MPDSHDVPSGRSGEQEGLAAALTREHHEIDGGIEAFVAGLADGELGQIPPGAGTLLRTFAALRRHIYLEEEFVFPPLATGALGISIQVMLREHGAIWRLMDEITELVDRPLADEPATDGELASRCAELLALLDRHNAKEEPVIYPRADSGLDPQARAGLGVFLRTGHMPSDWVCAGARTGSAG